MNLSFPGPKFLTFSLRYVGGVEGGGASGRPWASVDFGGHGAEEGHELHSQFQEHRSATRCKAN